MKRPVNRNVPVRYRNTVLIADLEAAAARWERAGHKRGAALLQTAALELKKRDER